ncbi:hypothetical protein JL720_11905 [Aureococcus anophagefferens]|nr:hypothetical protein JL720_11905 [Aureococcus anophagefferens]
MRPVSKPSRAFRPRLTPALATTTSTTEMIDAAESMVTSEETLRIGSLRFTRYDNASTGEPLLYCDEFLRDRDLLIRGLAHPVATNALSLFDAQSDATGPPDYWADAARDRAGGAADGDTFFQTFGPWKSPGTSCASCATTRRCSSPAASASRTTARTRPHELFWPGDGLRAAAAKYGADIVPFGAVGAADSFTIVRDKDEPLPFGGATALRRAERGIRRWANRTEDFRFPLAVPTSPRRFYFRSTSVLRP